MTALATKAMPLADALRDLATIVQVVDEREGEVPDELIPAFETGIENVKKAVDRRIGLLKAIPMAVEMLKAERDRLKAQIERLEAVATRVKESTQAHMTTFGSAKLEGNIGRFQIVQAGGKQAVDLYFGTYDLKDCVVEGDLGVVPPEYVSKRTVLVVDRAKLCEDMRNGIVHGRVETDDDGTVATKYAALRPRSSYVRIY
jgi:Siphovirus Gp157